MGHLSRAAFYVGTTRRCRGPIPMSAIGHFSVEQNTQQTTGASYATVSGCTLSNTNFAAGKKYLLVVTAQVASTSAFDDVHVKLRHGTTDFSGAEQITTVFTNQY